jgi:hypothetical protein
MQTNCEWRSVIYNCQTMRKQQASLLIVVNGLGCEDAWGVVPDGAHAMTVM